MSSIVIELQRDALDKNVPVSDLLRKAFVVARKLKIDEFQKWINKELNGYSEGCPEYRMMVGQVKAWNPMVGWIPVDVKWTELAKILSVMPCGQSVAEIEKTVDDAKQGSTLVMPYPKSTELDLMQRMDLPFVPALIVAKANLIGILEHVRNTILDWALTLDEQGIRGEDLSFTPAEKEKASTTNYHFHGNISDSQIQVGSHHSVQVLGQQLDLEKVRDFITETSHSIDKLDLEPHQKKELQAEIQTLKSQLASPRPKSLVIKECMHSARAILEGTIGSAIASGLLDKLSLFMPK